MFRRSFLSMLLAPAEDAPGGGGTPAPIVDPAVGKPPGAAPGPGPGSELDLDAIFRNPKFLAEFDRRMGETDKRAREEAEKKVRDEMAEAARLDKLSVEERAKQEAATAKGLATKAANDAADARAETSFLRALMGAGVQPHDELAEKMAWQAAKVLAGDGQPVTAETVAKLRSEKPYLFRSSSGAASQPAGTNPAELAAARTLSTQPAAGQAVAGQAQTPEDAFAMTDEQWAAVKKKHTGK